jgi:hypothetical protein
MNEEMEIFHHHRLFFPFLDAGLVILFRCVILEGASNESMLLSLL